MNFSYKLIIPKKYLIPQTILQEFLNFISKNMCKKKTGRPQKDSEPLVAGIYYLLRTGCQWNDTQLLIPIVDDLQSQINQSKNHFLHTGKGYTSKKNRKEAVSRNFTPVMPEKKPKNKPYANPPVKDLKRWVVERTFSWINRFRRVFVCYERKSKHFLVMVQFAFQIIIFKKI